MSWDQIQNTSSESLFVRLDEPRTQVRVLGDPVVYARHWTKSTTGGNCTVKCPDFGSITHKTCPVCAMNEKPRIRAIFPVIERKTNSVKLLDIPQTVAAQIKALKNNADWGDPLNYDITIQKNKVAKRTDYQVLPASTRVPLAQNEEVMVRNFLAKIDYKGYALPHTPEEIIAILNGHPIQKPGFASAGSYAGPQLAQAPNYTQAPMAPMAPIAPMPQAPMAPIAPMQGSPVLGDELINQLSPRPPQFPPRA